MITNNVDRQNNLLNLTYVNNNLCGHKTQGAAIAFQGLIKAVTIKSWDLFCNIFAAGLGFEPRYTAPEAVVLPLDDPAKFTNAA